MRVLVIGAAVVSASCGRIDFGGGGAMMDAPDTSIPPMVRYAMDDDPMTGVITASDARFNGTCTACPTATAGHTAGGYAFAGAHQVALPLISSGLAGAEPYTCAVWTLATVAAAQSIVAKPVSAASADDVFALQINNELAPYYETTNGSAPDYLIASTQIVGAWHHVAMTWDGATKRIYIDGVINGMEQPALQIDAVYPMWIGADQDDAVAAGFYSGSLDELTFYTRALDDAEIATLAAQ